MTHSGQFHSGQSYLGRLLLGPFLFRLGRTTCSSQHVVCCVCSVCVFCVCFPVTRSPPPDPPSAGPPSALPPDRPKFRVFFSFSPTIFILSSLSWGLLVEFWFCFEGKDPQMCTSYETSTSLGPPLFHTTAREHQLLPIPIQVLHCQQLDFLQQHAARPCARLIPHNYGTIHTTSKQFFHLSSRTRGTDDPAPNRHSITCWAVPPTKGAHRAECTAFLERRMWLCIDCKRNSRGPCTDATASRSLPAPRPAPAPLAWLATSTMSAQACTQATRPTYRQPTTNPSDSNSKQKATTPTRTSSNST